MVYSPFPPAQFMGLGVALATPFLVDGQVDYQSLGAIVRNIVVSKADFIVVFGTTGESPVVTCEEVEKVLSAVRREAGPNYPIVLGLGDNSTQRLIDRITLANSYDVQGFLSVVPYYNKPSQEGIYQHFAAAAQASDKPIILYNIRSRTGVDMDPDTVLRLRNNFPEKIVAIKEASGVEDRVTKLASLLDPAFTILSGDDHSTLELIHQGANGAVSVVANAYPAWTKELIDLAGSERAVEIDNAFAACYRLLFEEGNPAGIKEWLYKMQLINTPTLRLPLTRVSDKLSQKMEQSIDTLMKLGAH
ncbi:4-hydroxy-tetrahydrodipicolinate synthase [Porphyromonas sp.]|nr:4-hydroxy-tetrahydrodipicolinate synthase [uncultured Porphyromonas sp.]